MKNIMNSTLSVAVDFVMVRCFRRTLTTSFINNSLMASTLWNVEHFQRKIYVQKYLYMFQLYEDRFYSHIATFLVFNFGKKSANDYFLTKSESIDIESIMRAFVIYLMMFITLIIIIFLKVIPIGDAIAKAILSVEFYSNTALLEIFVL